MTDELLHQWVVYDHPRSQKSPGESGAFVVDRKLRAVAESEKLC
jgi:hypothetical protein